VANRALLLAAYGNVPAERAGNLIRMLLGMPVSPGFVDRANARLSERLADAGFDEAMRAALAAEPALGADETPVNVLARTLTRTPGSRRPAPRTCW
jgi:transposase